MAGAVSAHCFPAVNEFFELFQDLSKPIVAINEAGVEHKSFDGRIDRADCPILGAILSLFLVVDTRLTLPIPAIRGHKNMRKNKRMSTLSLSPLKHHGGIYHNIIEDR